MEKEQILSTINERLGAEGIKTDKFQRTFNTYIDANLPAEGTEPDDAYWNKHVGILKSLSGQFSHDVAEQVNDFKKNFKPETKPEDKGEKGEKSDLEKRLEQLEQARRDDTARARTDALRADVAARGKTLKVANEAIWQDAVQAVSIGENDSADDVTPRARQLYEQRLRRYMGDGAAPYGTTQHRGASKEQEQEALQRRDTFKKKMQARGKLPKDQ